MPEIKTWLFAVTIWAIAFIWAIVTIFLWLKSRKQIGMVVKSPRLNAIVPTLQEMDSLLRQEAEIVTQKPYDKNEYVNLNFRINAEIFRFTDRDIARMQEVKTPSEALYWYKKIQKSMINRYGNNIPNWFNSGNMIASVLDNKGFGLKEYKSKGKYKKLMNELSLYRTSVYDLQISNDINKHISESETLNTLLIAKFREADFSATIDGQTYTATSFLPLQLVANFEKYERETSKKMEETRRRISQRILDLEKQDEHRDDKSI